MKYKEVNKNTLIQSSRYWGIRYFKSVFYLRRLTRISLHDNEGFVNEWMNKMLNRWPAAKSLFYLSIDDVIMFDGHI